MTDEKIPIRAGNHRVVGHVTGSFFVKKVKSSKHFLRKPPAIATDVDSLKAAWDAGAHYMKVIDQETKMTYYATINDVWTHGIFFDRGWGKQVALPMRYWHKQRSDELFTLYAQERMNI